MIWLDARLPIRFGALDSRQGDEAVVTDGPRAAAPAAFFATTEAGHIPGCACCVPRSGAAAALGTLFRERATTAGPPFRGVLAVVGAAGEAAIRAALDGDPVVSARYRLASNAGSP